MMLGRSSSGVCVSDSDSTTFPFHDGTFHYVLFRGSRQRRGRRRCSCGYLERGALPRVRWFLDDYLSLGPCKKRPLNIGELQLEDLILCEACAMMPPLFVAI